MVLALRQRTDAALRRDGCALVRVDDGLDFAFRTKIICVQRTVLGAQRSAKLCFVNRLIQTFCPTRLAVHSTEAEDLVAATRYLHASQKTTSRQRSGLPAGGPLDKHRITIALSTAQRIWLAFAVHIAACTGLATCLKQSYAPVSRRARTRQARWGGTPTYPTLDIN